MGKDKLDALVKINQLQPESTNEDEVEALMESAKVRLVDVLTKNL